MTVHSDNLQTDLRINSPDDFYQELIELHAGLSDDESQKLNARLILILANHIGDITVLRQAFQYARPRDAGSHTAFTNQ
ncbi:MAG: DUF2783 domain-containing protein [Gammaproteobacteria bacterium]|uniref:DUF2783 domain-containing protein n=1 Tax=Pseudomaricurvus alcaniphilus TaxID=1166482 RepID=UPI0014074821|nr:DUF2783 domain-containing protein [Pseudomaricurvus alcaniphilus]MBR9908974.1 DUF2783 domain-containing protein [Gammaproteobacteria bacterium]NHN38027.1 DUF2783 domain-containing protein [Pseudomaricurvus alcaniphilus]